jgi:hypothetical protein
VLARFRRRHLGLAGSPVIAHATTTGLPSHTPAGALSNLRDHLAQPMWTDWTVCGDPVVIDYGRGEFEASVKLRHTLTEALKSCPHGIDPEDCTTCNPF